MAKKKVSKDKSRAKKSKKPNGDKSQSSWSSRTGFALPPELGERLTAAGAELQTRAEAMFAQWLDQASLTLRKSGAKSMFDELKAAGQNLRQSDVRTDFQRVARDLASTVASEITRFAVSTSLARGSGAEKPAAKTATKPAPKKAAAKPKTKTATVPRQAPTANTAKSKPATKVAKPAARKPASVKTAPKTAPGAAGKPAAPKSPPAKPVTARPAAKVAKPAAAKTAPTGTAATKPAPRRRAPRPASRPASKK